MVGGKSNAKRTSQGRQRGDLSQYGLMNIPNLMDFDNPENDDLDDDDEALEAELLALTTGGGPAKKKAVPKKVVNLTDLDKMVQESLKDIPSDVSSEDEDESRYLAELNDLQSDDGEETETKISETRGSAVQANILPMLQERLNMYETAEKNAKSVGEVTKAKRMARGIKTLNDLIRKANNGQYIPEDDIPPVVSTAVPKLLPAAQPLDDNKSVSAALDQFGDNLVVSHNQDSSQVKSISPPPIPPRAKRTDESMNLDSTPETKPAESPKKERLADVPSVNPVAELLMARQDQYKKAALAAKKNGDRETALKYVQILRQFDTVINAAKEGSTIDMSTLPPELNTTLVSTVSVPGPKLQRHESEKQQSSPTPEQENIQSPAKVVEAPSAPHSVLEALEQRLQKFKESEESAKQEDNASKVRRMNRIVKQYEDAIKRHKAGKPIPIDELPTPPGFAPIPVDPVPSSSSNSETAAISPPKTAAIEPAPPAKRPAAPAAPVDKSKSGRSSGHITRNEQQLKLAIERHQQYRNEAIKAKKENDIEKAKSCLRIMKQIEPMIEAARGGLPIDLSSLPLPPGDKENLNSDLDDFDVIRLNDCLPGNESEIYTKLEDDLTEQMKLCTRTSEHFKSIGDIASANRLDQLLLQTKKDLKFIKLAHMNNLKVPEFHYESKTFSIVNVNTDLTDNDVEVNVVQGINYNVPNPKEIDTYIKLSFPYPTELPQQAKSSVIYNTNNPEYKFTHVFNMQRNVRACQRMFKRQAIKCEVWSKGGFFRSDAMIGVCNIKLLPLESQCMIHDAFDLMDGRRSVGGKLEVKVRVRTPLVSNHVETVVEKWLIIDT